MSVIERGVSFFPIPFNSWLLNLSLPRMNEETFWLNLHLLLFVHCVQSFLFTTNAILINK